MRAGVLAILFATATPLLAGSAEGMALFKGGKLLEAAAEFQTIVDRDPSDDHAWFMLGQCLRSMDRPSEAERALRRALALRDDRPEYHHALAVALRDLGRPREAVAAAVEGLNRDPSSAARYALHAVLGVALGDLGRWPEAAGQLERARALRADARILDLLGRAYFAYGDDARAVAAWADAQLLDPDNGERIRLVIEAILRVASRTSDRAEKDAAYAKALELAAKRAEVLSDDPDADYLFGRAALGAGRFEEAGEAFRRVLAIRPRQCFAMVNLARALLAMEREVEAEGFLQRATACAPRLPAVHETLGQLFLRLGRDAEAARAFTRALALDPTPTATAGFREARRRLAAESRDAETVPVKGR